MPKLGDRRLVKEWDDDNANNQYNLYEYTCTPETYYQKAWLKLASGDKAWANRIARHYKLEVEDE